MKRCLLVAVLVLISLMGLFASDGGQYTLVVDNGAYEKTMKFANPVNDACDVAGRISVPVRRSTFPAGVAEYRSAMSTL